MRVILASIWLAAEIRPCRITSNVIGSSLISLGRAEVLADAPYTMDFLWSRGYFRRIKREVDGVNLADWALRAG